MPEKGNSWAKPEGGCVGRGRFMGVEAMFVLRGAGVFMAVWPATGLAEPVRVYREEDMEYGRVSHSYLSTRKLDLNNFKQPDDQ